MFEVHVPKFRIFDEANHRFIDSDGGTLLFEHSLKSISKWEKKYKVPYLHKHDFKPDEVLYYIECMLVKNAPDILVKYFVANMPDELSKLWDYISTSQTATWFKTEEGKSKHSEEIITHERLYFWMSAYHIDWQAQYWHLSNLLAIIRIAQEENKPKKKMSRDQVMAQHTQLNKARRAASKAKKR